MRISDWSSDVCSSDLLEARYYALALWQFMPHFLRFVTLAALTFLLTRYISLEQVAFTYAGASLVVVGVGILYLWQMRSEEHTSELQSLMCISYAVFCLKKKK